MAKTFSYRDDTGLTNRANSAMLRIEQIIQDTSLPSAVRLVRIAQVMESEPVLTDSSGAAYGARMESQRRQLIADSRAMRSEKS